MALGNRIRRVKFLIACDLYRFSGQVSLKSFLRIYFTAPGFNFMVWFRLCSEFCSIPIKFILLRKRNQLGIDIYPKTRIGKGFYIGHFGTIVVSSAAKIGDNCNISQGVTIGFSSRGRKKGAPEIGDQVYIGPGAKILGQIKIGNNVAIGANAVVIDNVPDNAVVVGVPGRVVSLRGAEGYILNII